MEQPAPVTFLVLSDIHFGKLSYVPELACANAPPRNVVQNAVHLIDSLVATVSNMSTPPTAILAPGDLTSVAAPAEFIGCQKAVNQIAERLKINGTNVFFTFGNHDTNWRIAELGKETDRFAADEAYALLAAQVGSSFAKNHTPIDSGPVIGSGVFVRDSFVLFVLNSGHCCTEEQTFPHGSLGREQLEWIQRMLVKHADTSKWNVLMVHHHPYNYPFPSPVVDISSIQEGAELIALAGKSGIDVICHGHRHHPKIFTAHETGWIHPITFLCAGSVSVNEEHRMRGEIPNLFHVLHLERRLEDGAAFGNVISNKYRVADGWLQVINDLKYTPIDPVQRFGVLPDKTKAQRLITEIVENAITGPGQVWDLPAFDALPVALQCCAITQLNEMLKHSACAHGVKILGYYPGDTFIKK